MFSNTVFLMRFYEINTWLRALIIFGVIGLIIWPICMPLIMRVILLITKVFVSIIKGLYIIISWFIISPLQKIFGGIFTKINNNLTSFTGYICENIESIYDRIKDTKKRYIWQIILIIVILSFLIGIPGFFKEIEQDSKWSIARNIYTIVEGNVFGYIDSDFIANRYIEPTPSPKITSSPRINPLPTPIETITPTPLIQLKVKKGSTINLRKKADINSRIIRTINSNTTIYYMGKTKKNKGYEWIYVKTSKGEVGWCAKNYIKELP